LLGADAPLPDRDGAPEVALRLAVLALGALELAEVGERVDGEPYVKGCTYDEPPAGKIRDLIDMFPYKAYGDTCAPSYAPFFDEAADMIGEACGSFIPQ